MVLSIIIPVHNEESTIDEVIARIRAVDLGDIGKEMLIVDDASNDDTASRLDAYRNDPDVLVFTHSKNRGKGAAIRTALAHSTGDVVVIQDADLEYDPRDYSRMLAPILSGDCDVVYGSRFMDRHGLFGRPDNMATANFIANKLLAWATTILFRKHITDEATCYKMFRADVLSSFDLRCERFEFCPEVTAKSLKRGYRLVEVPISYHARTVEAGKKIRAWDGVEAIWTLVRFRFMN